MGKWLLIKSNSRAAGLSKIWRCQWLLWWLFRPARQAQRAQADIEKEPILKSHSYISSPLSTLRRHDNLIQTSLGSLVVVVVSKILSHGIKAVTRLATEANHL